MPFPANLASLHRLIWLDCRLSRSGGVTVKDAAWELGVSIKTIRRDLNTLHCVLPMEWRTLDHGEKRWRYIPRRRRVFASWLD